MVCLCFVYPRVVTFNKSLEFGIPKNWLLKKLKKDIGPKDYKMWMDNNLLVHFPGDASLIGSIVNVHLDTCKGFYYLGSLQECQTSG